MYRLFCASMTLDIPDSGGPGSLGHGIISSAMIAFGWSQGGPKRMLYLLLRMDANGAQLVLFIVVPPHHTTLNRNVTSRPKPQL